MESNSAVGALVDIVRALIGRSSPTDRKGAGRRPQFSLTGPLSAGKSTDYSINGVDFEVASETVVIGELKFGALAQVTGDYRKHTVRCATRIITAAQRREPHRS
ncbi:MAG: hypothetical protein RL417_2199 [Pseudomonadota bacterium]|jgi:hypothetical protein